MLIWCLSHQGITHTRAHTISLPLCHSVTTMYVALSPSRTQTHAQVHIPSIPIESESDHPLPLLGHLPLPLCISHALSLSFTCQLVQRSKQGTHVHKRTHTHTHMLTHTRMHIPFESKSVRFQVASNLDGVFFLKRVKPKKNWVAIQNDACDDDDDDDE